MYEIGISVFWLKKSEKSVYMAGLRISKKKRKLSEKNPTNKSNHKFLNHLNFSLINFSRNKLSDLISNLMCFFLEKINEFEKTNYQNMS